MTKQVSDFKALIDLLFTKNVAFEIAFNQLVHFVDDYYGLSYFNTDLYVTLINLYKTQNVSELQIVAQNIYALNERVYGELKLFGE